MASFNAIEIEFVDLSLPIDVDYHLDVLFKNLKKHYNRKTGEGFWGKRDFIKRFSNQVVIAAEKGLDTQVGFCVASVDAEDRTITVYLIQSFKQRCGVATALLDHVAARSPGYVILVKEPFVSSLPFWRSYFKKNPLATYPIRLVFLPHHDGGEGPHFRLRAPLSKARFVQILAELDSEYENKDQRTFEPYANKKGGIKVVLKHGGYLRLCFTNGIFPWVSESWEEEWKSDQCPALATQSFKSSIGYSSPDLQWQPEDFHIIKRVFQRHGVTVNFFIHTK